MTEPAAINALTTQITSHSFASSSFGYPSTTVPPQILGPQNTQINIGTLVAADAEEDDDEPEPKGEGDERLQPKQQNEQLCSSCFLLVKSSAPNCPVGDDDCPIFS